MLMPPSSTPVRFFHGWFVLACWTALPIVALTPAICACFIFALIASPFQVRLLLVMTAPRSGFRDRRSTEPAPPRPPSAAACGPGCGRGRRRRHSAPPARPHGRPAGRAEGGQYL